MIANSKAPIVVIGAGYVGLITAIGLARCRRVRLVDDMADLIAALERGEAPFDEPELQERLDALTPGRLTYEGVGRYSAGLHRVPSEDGVVRSSDAGRLS